jgi:type II secretion system protein H
MSRRGFTLIELMVVVLLIAVLSTLALPQLGGVWSNTQLNAAADDLTRAARFAQRMAVSTQRSLRLVVVEQDPETGRSAFRVEVESTDLESPEAYAEISGRLGRNTLLPDSVRIADVLLAEQEPLDPTTAVTFRPDGTADATVIQLLSNDRVVSIMIEPNRGRVQRVDEPVQQLPNAREDLDV